MPLEVQARTLDVLEAALRRRVYSGPTPSWLRRPGRVESGSQWRRVRLLYRRLSDGMELPDVMPPRERRTVDAIIGGRGMPWLVVEVDESQHFNEFRAATLNLYPPGAPLGFPRQDWLAASLRGRATGGGGWAAPKPPLFPMEGGRHRQRAFRDALADLLPPVHGYAPTLRIADFEVRGWLWERGAASRMRRLVQDRLEAAELGEGADEPLVSRG